MDPGLFHLPFLFHSFVTESLNHTQVNHFRMQQQRLLPICTTQKLWVAVRQGAKKMGTCGKSVPLSFLFGGHTWVQNCGCKIVSSCGVSGRSFRQSRLSRPQGQRLKSRKKARPPIPPMGTGELWLTTEIGGDVGHQNNRAKIQNARTTIMQSGGDCIVLFEGKGAKPELLDFASFCPNSCSPRDSLLPPIVS